MSLIEKLDRKWYPTFQNAWDAVHFRAYILARLDSAKTLLDIGAGRGVSPNMHFKGLAGRVIGIDIDPVVLTNPHVDEAHVTKVDRFDGVADASVDVAVAKDVMEHVAEPKAFLSEVARVLKPGGVFLGKTPNRWHYMPIIASATPFWFHKFYNRMRGRAEIDTFPTTYRLNSRGAIARHAAAAGLVVEEIVFEEGRPEYLRLSVPTYFAGYAYERLVNGLRLDAVKSVIYVSLKKPGQD